MSTNRKQRIGVNVTLARMGAGLSKAELAKIVDVQRHRVNDWEIGRHRPSDDHIELIAQATGRNFAWFFDEHEDEGQ